MNERGICIDGWGGYAEIEDYLLVADYQPGVFELGPLLASGLGALTAILSATLAVSMSLWGWNTLGWVCLVASFSCLVGASVAWHTALLGLFKRGERRIDLLMGSVEVDGRSRPLSLATIEIETAPLIRGLTLARLSLSYPDGLRIPIVQGHRRGIEELARRIRRAPSLTIPRAQAA